MGGTSRGIAEGLSRTIAALAAAAARQGVVPRADDHGIGTLIAKLERARRAAGVGLEGKEEGREVRDRRRR